MQIKNIYLQVIPLLLILLLGWAVRIYALDSDSLWSDDIFSYERAIQPNIERLYVMLLQGNHPPLYELVILSPWQKLGSNDFFLRFPSVFFGTLTISVVYLLGKAAFDRTIAHR